jgi:hypothetical protein
VVSTITSGWHSPPAQASFRHAWPHAPQFALLVSRSTQSEPHSTSPPVHWQVPATQCLPLVHAGTQLPLLLEVLEVLEVPEVLEELDELDELDELVPPPPPASGPVTS